MSWNPFQIFSGSSSLDPGPLHLRLMSFNIRYATSSPFQNERPWQERAPHVMNQIQHELWPISASLNGSSQLLDGTSDYASGFVCLQEVLHVQLLDILAGLNGLSSSQGPDPPAGPFWAHIGVGRDDGKTKGEYSPIIYPVDHFSLLHYESVWLSPTPDRPSKGWDAGSIRILTVGVFEHKSSRHKVIAANTHLDNEGSRSRLESVNIVLTTLKRVEEKWGGTSKIGMFLAGDFNSLTSQEAYKAMNGSGYMSDLRDSVGPRKRYGEDKTFTGFQPDKSKGEQGRIDFIWLGPRSDGEEGRSHWSVEGYSVLPNVFEAGVYLSDHRAVVGDVALSKK